MFSGSGKMLSPANHMQFVPSKGGGGGGDGLNKSLQTSSNSIIPGLKANDVSTNNGICRYTVPQFFSIYDQFAEKSAIKALCTNYKSRPIYAPVLSRRPYMGICCDCLPHSAGSLINDDCKALGLRNILLVKTQQPEYNFFTRRTCYLSYLWQHNPKFSYPVVEETVLQDERMQQALKERADEVVEHINGKASVSPGTILEDIERRASRVLKKMRTAISTGLLKFTAWLMYRILSYMMKSVAIHKGQMRVLHQASETGLPLIFLPLHRSHVDYILITFILYISGIRVPAIAAGDNLNIPVLGNLLRGLGAFFIKRKLDPVGQRDVVYRSLLHTYVLELLRAGHNLEFFTEGGRSRTGKPCMPKGGLLSIVVDAFTNGDIEDALLVPVSVGYERIADGNFVSEQLGKPKIRETFFGTLKAIASTIFSRRGAHGYGLVRVDFAQPFSLQEFVGSYKQLLSAGPRLSLHQPDFISSICNNRLKSQPSSASLFGTDIVSEEQRQLVEILAQHVVYDASRSGAIMSTSLVAFALLTRFRDGVPLTTLVTELARLKMDLFRRGRDCGFSGESLDWVNHAINILGPALIRKEIDSNNDVIIHPVTMLPNVIELAYYANTAALPYILEAIVATSILTTVEPEYMSYVATSQKEFRVDINCIKERSLQLCEILQFEFILTPSCTPIDSAVNGLLLEYKSSDLLKTVPSAYTNYVASRKDPYSFSQDYSDSEDELFPEMVRVSTDAEHMKKLINLNRILVPTLDTYYWTACCLADMDLDTDVTECDLYHNVLSYIKKKLESSNRVCGESLSMEMVRGAVKLFEHWHLLECNVDNSVRKYHIAGGAADSLSKTATFFGQLLW